MSKIWAPVDFGEGKYFVSNFGDVKNIITNKLLATQVQNSGYLIVHLHQNNKRKAFTIHRLVAIAFIDNPNSLPQVNHKDGNKLNNNSDNLEWANQSDNICHAQKMGLMVNRIASATSRMSAIGKAFSIANGERLIEMNKKKRKPVLQLSLTGEFLKEWPSVRSVQDAKIAHNIGKVLKGEYAQSGGFKWQWKV